jgi:hypothetical protein
MANFPTLPVPSRQFFSQKPVKAQVKTKMEDGTVQSRPQHTRMRWTFTIGWDVLSETDYATLHAFFNTYIGSTFNWTHPITSVTHVVRFVNDELPEAKHGGHIGGVFGWEMSGIMLEEA